jgi:hypothetical protein
VVRGIEAALPQTEERFPDEVSMQYLYDTEHASVWLERKGIRRTPKTLRKLRCCGGGPKFHRFNGKPFYTELDLVVCNG